MNTNDCTYLAHHGVKGQKWGVRRYQNEDGSYTEAGKKRYRDSPGDSPTKKGLSSSMKKKILVAGIGAAIAAVGYVSYSNFIRNKAYKDCIEDGQKYANMYRKANTDVEESLGKMFKERMGDDSYRIVSNSIDRLVSDIQTGASLNAGKIRKSTIESTKYEINRKKKNENDLNSKVIGDVIERYHW